MDTQNTPIHIRLWHKDFWKLAFAEFALVASISMLAVIAPERARILGLDMEETALMAVCYGIASDSMRPVLSATILCKTTVATRCVC